MEEKRVIEILLGAILVVLLVVLVFLTLGMSTKTVSSSGSSVSNSYNVNTYNTYSYPTTSGIYGVRKNVVSRVEERDLRYTSWGSYDKTKALLGQSYGKYSVYVKNRDNERGYFTVDYDLYDISGKKRSISVTKLIYPGEKEKFVYRDIGPYRSPGYSWRYSVRLDVVAW
tara:strand:+ start:574 stop:1083 length:510 start_codon:yes stop_codon:yes gene_type:complete